MRPTVPSPGGGEGCGGGRKALQAGQGHEPGAGAEQHGAGGSEHGEVFPGGSGFAAPRGRGAEPPGWAPVPGAGWTRRPGTSGTRGVRSILLTPIPEAEMPPQR